MIYIYANNSKYRHDIFELVRELELSNKIKFIISLEEILNIKDFNTKIILEDKKTYLESRLISKNGNVIKDFTKYNINYSQYLSEKTIINNAYKRSILKLYNKLGIFNEWGILTGIRPMKIVHNLLDLNLNYLEIKKILKKEYLLSEKVILKMIQIAKVQRKHIKYIDNNKISLYVNIPFCPTRCSYCSFSSYTIKDYTKVDEYIETLLYEIEKSSEFLKDKEVECIYVGGGTPTAIKKQDLIKIIQKIIDSFNIDVYKLKEFTVEAGRPDTITKDYLKELKSIGVNRISINPQTMNNNTLKKIKRGHDKNLIIKAYNVAKEIEFDIINMDVIVGLPGEDLIDIKNTIDEVIKLDPDNLTVHSLAIKRGSLLANNNYKITTDSISEDKLNSIVQDFLQGSDFVPYYLYRQKQSFLNSENIGYSKQNKESIYNILMMEERQTIIGLGLGAVSKIVNSDKSVERIPNFKGLKDYNSRVEELIVKKKKVVNKLK